MTTHVPPTLNSLALSVPPHTANTIATADFGSPTPVPPQQDTRGWAGCSSCERQRAQWVLSWPDAHFLLCSGCLPPSCTAVAEPAADFDPETLAEMAAAVPSGPHLLPAQHSPLLVRLHRSPGVGW